MSKKPFWRSMTIQGIVIALMPVILAKFGITFEGSGEETLMNSVVTMLDEVITIGGSLMAVWGRKRATTRLSVK